MSISVIRYARTALCSWNLSVRLDGMEVFATPSALIGLNHGITVIDYKDIAAIQVKRIDHSERRYRGRRHSFFGALVSAATDRYREWST